MVEILHLTMISRFMVRFNWNVSYSDRSSASPQSSHTSIHNAKEDIPLLSVPECFIVSLTSTMRLLLAYCSGSFIGLFGAGCSAETQLVMKDRSYYAWGYEGDTTEGVPNG